jgi:hypothetical protein
MHIAMLICYVGNGTGDLANENKGSWILNTGHDSFRAGQFVFKL